MVYTDLKREVIYHSGGVRLNDLPKVSHHWVIKPQATSLSKIDVYISALYYYNQFQS